MDITRIAELAIALLCAIITYVAIPYYKSKTTREQRENVKFWVGQAVNAAEKIFNGKGQGAAKKQYVIEFLAAHGIALDEQQLDVVIESAVLEMQIALSD